jgi:CRP/FNR family transcriptional regulator
MSPVTFRLVPPDVFHAALAEPGFRQFVMQQFVQRLSDLLSLVHAVSTHRLDQRLAARLLAHGPDCTLTHQQLADELGSVRELVTRMLHHFVEEGWVSVERGHIRILEPELLRRFSQPSP